MTPRLVLLSVGFVLLSGCAWTAQQVNLKPNVWVSEATLGQGKTVYIEVEDERPSNSLGTKIPVGGGQITPLQDPGQVVAEALVLGMTRLGFKPVLSGAEDGTKLRGELRAIDYKVSQGFWAGGLTVDVALKAICIVDGRRKYEKLHRGHHEESIQVVQSATSNESYINDALSQAINQVLADGALMQCLGAGATP